MFSISIVSLTKANVGFIQPTHSYVQTTKKQIKQITKQIKLMTNHKIKVGRN